MTTSTDKASTTTVSEPSSSGGPSPRHAVFKKNAKKKKKAREGDRGAGLLGLPADAFQPPKFLRLPGSSASESDPGQTPSTSVDSGPSSGDVSFSQTTKRNTAKNGRTLNAGKLLNDKKEKDVSSPKKAKGKTVIGDESPRKKAKGKVPKSEEMPSPKKSKSIPKSEEMLSPKKSKGIKKSEEMSSPKKSKGKVSVQADSPSKKAKSKVTIEEESPRKKVKDKIFAEGTLSPKKGKDKIFVEGASPRKKLKDIVLVDGALSPKMGKNKVFIEEQSPRKKPKEMVLVDEISPPKKGKKKAFIGQESPRKKMKDVVFVGEELPLKGIDKIIIEEVSPRKKAKNKVPKEEKSPRKKAKDKIPEDEMQLQMVMIAPDELSPRKKKDKVMKDEESPRKRAKDKPPREEESPVKKKKGKSPKEKSPPNEPKDEGSPRKKSKEKATKDKSSAAKKSKKKKEIASEEESDLSSDETAELEEPIKSPEGVFSDSDNSEMKPVQHTPSKFIVYLEDSSKSYGSGQAASSTSVTDASYDLARLYLQCKEKQKRRALESASSTRSDTYLILDKCCRCGAGSEMVGEITGKLPACHYCLEEMGLSKRRPPVRTRSYRVVDNIYETRSASKALLQPVYSRSACTTEVSELRRYCDPSDKVLLCGSSVGVDTTEKYDDLPDDYYKLARRESRRLKPADGLHRKRSFYSHPRGQAEQDMPEVRIRAHLSRERQSRNRDFPRSCSRLLDSPPDGQRTGKSARNYGRDEPLDSQSLMLGDMREDGWERDYDEFDEEINLGENARGSVGSRRFKGKEREKREGDGRHFKYKERLQDQETEEGKVDIQLDFSVDELFERSPEDESKNEEPSGVVGATEAKVPEPEEVAQQAWERYARDYKRFQENLAEWKYEQEKAHRRRLRDGGDGRPRRPVTPPMPNTSFPGVFEKGSSHISSEEPKSKKDDDSMRIRIAVSPSRRSRLMMNEVTSWTPGPFPPVGADGMLPVAQAGHQLPMASAVTPVRNQPHPLQCAPAAHQLFFAPQANPAAQPSPAISPTHSMPSPVSPMSPPMSGVCSPVSAQSPPAGPVPQI